MESAIVGVRKCNLRRSQITKLWMFFEKNPANWTHNPQLHTRPTTCKPKPKVPQAATICITLELLMMGIMVPETCWASNKFCNKETKLLHLVGHLNFHILTTMQVKLTSSSSVHLCSLPPQLRLCIHTQRVTFPYFLDRSVGSASILPRLLLFLFLCVCVPIVYVSMYLCIGCAHLVCFELFILRAIELNWTELNWTALHWTELHCTELNWTALHWTELHWTELNWTELHWTELNWTELNWTELNWTELNWTKLN